MVVHQYPAFVTMRHMGSAYLVVNLQLVGIQMTPAQEMTAILDRHVARMEAAGDKLMNAERDMDRLLTLWNDMFAPVILAAREVHEYRGAENPSQLGFLEKLTDLSMALKKAGLASPAIPKGTFL